MRVLTFASQKGGSGKTTLAANIAAAAAADGDVVVAIDIDPQRSLSAWGARRREQRERDVVFRKATPETLHGLIGRIRDHGVTTLIIVDTPGIFGPSVNQALIDADLCIIPVKPSILDVEASRPLAIQLELLQQPFAFVLNQVLPTSQGRAVDAATALARIGPLAPCTIANRTDFLDAALAGLSAADIAPRGKAAEEIAVLWSWIKTQLDEAGNG